MQENIIVLVASDRAEQTRSFLTRIPLPCTLFDDFYDGKTPKTLVFNDLLHQWKRFILVASPEIHTRKDLLFFATMIMDEELVGKKQFLPFTFSKEDWETFDLYPARSYTPARLFQRPFSSDDLETALQKQAEQVTSLLQLPL